MTLLYEAAKKVHSPDGGLGTAALNPTPGLKRRDPDLFKRIFWKPDPNEPDKGVFVATDVDIKSHQLQRELPPGILVTQSSLLPAAGPSNSTPQGGNLRTAPMPQPQINQQYNAMSGSNMDQMHSIPNLAQMASQNTDISNQPVSYLVSGVHITYAHRPS